METTTISVLELTSDNTSWQDDNSWHNDFLDSKNLHENREFLNMLTIARKPKHIVYLKENHETSLECTAHITDIFECTWELASTWEDITKYLSNGDRKIVTHVSMIENSNSSVSDFVRAIESIVKFMPITSPLLIGVVITKDTDISIINQLRKTSVTGLLLDINDYSVEEVKISLEHFLNRKPYWPNHVISELPNNTVKTKPIHVCFKKNWVLPLAQEDLNKLTSPDLPWSHEFCYDWTDLGEILKKDPHQIVVDIESITQNGTSINDFVMMLETFIKGAVPNKAIPIACAINKNTTVATIKELQKAGVFGIVPTIVNFGFEEAYRGIDALFNRIPYWPKHILDQLPNDKKPKLNTTNGITLTPRQQQIFKLVSTRGASNKVIAKTLNITESTVKAHVSAILKAYGVRNRTQLVVSANSHS